MVLDRIMKPIQRPESTPKVTILNALLYDIVESILTVLQLLRRILSCNVEYHLVRTECSNIVVNSTCADAADGTVHGIRKEACDIRTGGIPFTAWLTCIAVRRFNEKQVQAQRRSKKYSVQSAHCWCGLRVNLQGNIQRCYYKGRKVPQTMIVLVIQIARTCLGPSYCESCECVQRLGRPIP